MRAATRELWRKIPGSITYCLLVIGLHWGLMATLRFGPAWLMGVEREVTKLGIAAIVGGAWLLGLGRNLAHPAASAAYRAWLETTPWRRGIPLPLGSVMLGLRDAVSIGAFVVAGWLVGGPRLGYAAGIGWGLGYLLGVMGPLFRSGRKVEGVAVLVGLGLIVWERGGGWAIPTTMAALVAISQAGIWVGLAAFPWTKGEEKVKPTLEGGPEGRTAPFELKPRMHWCWVALGSATVGWWAYVLCELGESTERAHMEQVMGLSAAVGFVIGLIRWVSYVVGLRAPLGMWGRLRTGMFVFREWDIVYVAPIVIFLLTGIAVLVERSAGRHWPVVVGAGLAVVLFAAMRLGPRREWWKLCGGWSVEPRRNRRAG